MTALSPAAPGRIGEAILPQLLLHYLQSLDAWVIERRAELDALDEAVQQLPAAAPGSGAPSPRALTGDIMLSLTLWQAVKSRLELLTATWDSGRVGEVEREKMSTLIWGRLDTTVGTGGANTTLAGMNLSLPEACRLSDALAGQLRTRLGLAPSVDAVASRVRRLKVDLERLRDQVAIEPPETLPASRAKMAQLDARLGDLEQKLARGGDVGGLIGPLEIESAKFERDLIVGGAERRKNKARATGVAEHLRSLQATEDAMRKLVENAVAMVTPAPKYAVPEVAALGPVPADPAALDAYAARLTQVGKAMQVVQGAYSKAIAEHTDLVARLDAAQTKAEALGLSDAGMAEVLATARRLLATSPTPMTVARSLVDAYVNHVSLASKETDR